MKSIINELWHGNIVPQEDSRNNTKEMKELISYIARHDEDLGKLLTEEQKAIFEKYQDCWNEHVSLAEAAIFEYAFKLGARLMLARLSLRHLNLLILQKGELENEDYLRRT